MWIRMMIVVVFLGLSSGAAAAPPSIPADTSADSGRWVRTADNASDRRTLAATVVDLDGDGSPELVTAEVDASGNSWLQQQPSPLGVETCFAATSGLSRRSMRLGFQPNLLAAGDIDADGVEEVAFGQRGSDRLFWLPAATSTELNELILPGPLRALYVADIDRRDGLVELLVAIDGDQALDRLLVYRSLHGAAYSAPESVDLPAPITGLAAVHSPDPGRDGVVDLLVQAGGDPWLISGRAEINPRQLELAADLPRQARPVADETIIPVADHRPRVAVADGRAELETVGLASTFVVNSLLDASDDDPGDGICDTNPLPDSSPCTLRAAVEEANASPGTDVIEFGLQGAAPHVLDVGGPSPIDVTEPVVIDGTSQPGYAGTPVVELAFSGGGIVPGLLISGFDAVVCGLSITGFPGEGLSITGDDAIIEGNWIGLDPAGVAAGNLRGIGIGGVRNRIGGTTVGAGNVISSNTTGGVAIGVLAMDNVLYNNRVGTDPDGLVDMPNGGIGVRVDGSFNAVGGAAARAGNVISGNISVGVFVGGDDVLVQSNDIGVGAGDVGLLGNGFAGIFVDDGADRPMIGGVFTVGNRIRANVPDLAGFGGSGIVMRGSAEARIQGNVIGSDGTRGNHLHGIMVEKVSPTVPRDGLIGGPMGELGNVIQGNGRFGLIGHGILLIEAEDFIIANNSIGIDDTGLFEGPNSGDGIRLVESSGFLVGGAPPLGGANTIAYNVGNGIGLHDLDFSPGLQNTLDNTLSRNELFLNGALGIDLTIGGPVPNGPTANDDDDLDVGPNRGQNFPTLDPPVRVGMTTTLSGDLSSAPSSIFRIELFDNSACDPSGFGEAERYLGSVDITTDGSGDASFSFPTPSFVTFPTATATLLASGDTSELSPCTDSVMPGSGFLGDRVWHDLDADGLQANGEPGLADVTVRLLEATGGTELDSTTTDAEGIYRFTGLATGVYRVAVDLPPSARFVDRDVGANDDLDSDIEPSSGMTETFSYTTDTIDVSRDAGITWLIFSDGFESGDLTRWSSSVP